MLTNKAIEINIIVSQAIAHKFRPHGGSQFAQQQMEGSQSLSSLKTCDNILIECFVILQTCDLSE